MEVAGALFQAIDYLKKDELKHGTWEGKIGAENQLNRPVTELVVTEKFLHEEDPPNDEKDDLGRHNHHAVPKQTHFDVSYSLKYRRFLASVTIFQQQIRFRVIVVFVDVGD